MMKSTTKKTKENTKKTGISLLKLFYSNCCGEAVYGEIVDGIGICSKCYEGAVFEPVEEE